MKFRRNAKIDDFESAAMPHIDALYRAAARVTGDRSEAEDLVQETYLQAWKSFHRFQPGTNCRAWLFKILFHVIQQHRRKWYSSRGHETDELLEQTVAYQPPVAQHLKDEDVLAAFDKIPQQYRDVVLLADVEAFSYKEIAETLSIPLGTVMSRLSRGRKLLRSELAGFAEGYGINKSNANGGGK
ncbi:MAG TPA: sigma-70 family RNA polymerase sigma factor [Blastocatellia bacterium]|nr:sigma-70 family RNA polymerase sigma factor [Blastocatellia bacterium]